MPVYQDLSRWSETLKDKALLSILYQDVILIDGTHMKTSENVDAKLRAAPHFWLVFCTGVEMLMKSVLLKHNLLVLQRRAPRDAINNIIDPAVAAVYKATSQAVNVRAGTNLALQAEFDRLHIQSLFSINTPTLGPLARRRGVQLLLDNHLIDVDQSRLMTERMECLAFTRRNIESHINLGVTFRAQINSDLDLVYVPLVNSLLAI